MLEIKKSDGGSETTPNSPVTDVKSSYAISDTKYGTEVKSAIFKLSDDKRMLTVYVTLGSNEGIKADDVDVSNLISRNGTFNITANSVTYTVTYTLKDGYLTITNITGESAS